MVSIEGKTSLRTVGLPTVVWLVRQSPALKLTKKPLCLVQLQYFFQAKHLRNALSNQFPLICTLGTRNLTEIRANRTRSGEFAVVLLELGGRLSAKIPRGNLSWRTLTEPHAPQMIWLNSQLTRSGSGWCKTGLMAEYPWSQCQNLFL